MMNGYAMSGWGWLLMTLGILGFWALVAVLALALLRHPGPPNQQRQPGQQPRPGAEDILAERLARGEIDPTSTASASRPSRRPPTGRHPR
jgi:putative membrane protein